MDPYSAVALLAQPWSDRFKDPVFVYRYTYWDEESGENKQSSDYATDELIKAGLGIKIASTAMRVERTDLRDGGFYSPGGGR